MLLSFHVLDAMISHLDPDDVFGRVSGDLCFLELAASPEPGPLGTPCATVRHGTILNDDDGTPTLTLGPRGTGPHGIPTGKDFSGVHRAYVPHPDAAM